MKLSYVIGVAAVLFILNAIAGNINGKTILGIIVLLFIGALYPPIGIGLGALFILKFLLQNGGPVFSWLNQKLGGKKQ